MSTDPEKRSIQNGQDLWWAIASHAGGITGLLLENEEMARQQVKHAAYENTECGAWVEFADGAVWVGSIVEGAERSASPIELRVPFSLKEYNEALDQVEQEARRIWMETHGCEECWPDGYPEGDPKGYYCSELEQMEFPGWPVNPECPTCEGEGVVI